MKYYLMGRKVDANATLLNKRSHRFVETKTGQPFPADFEGPLVTQLDDDNVDGTFPTFYEGPAVIGRVEFYQDLKQIGVDNIEVHAVEIRDEVNHKTIDGYLLLNIIGKVDCADLSQSDVETLGDNMHVINKLVIDPSRTLGLDLFLEANDTDCIVISEKVYKHLLRKGYTDIYFEELATV